jgi:signal transduction histidine kinase/CHASE2 domain-containing sensor protein
LLGQLARAASAEQPKAIGLDILLSEPEDATEDAQLASALKEAGNAVLVAKISDSPQGRLWVEPLPLFAKSAAAIGHAQAVLGPDGICRSVPVRELSLEEARWAFALEVARIASGARLEDGGHELRLGERTIPVVQTASHAAIAGVESETPRFLLIDYRGEIAANQGPSPFSAVSAADLLEGKAGRQLRGKAVLIGFGSTEIGDRIPTPVSGKLPMPGVEIHANLVDTILAGRSLSVLNVWWNLGFLFIFSFVSTWVVLRWPVWKGLVVLAALLAVGVVASYLAFLRTHVLVGLGPFLCVGLLAGPLAQLQNLVIVDRDLARGLQQLQNFLRAAEPAKIESLPAALRSEIQPARADLHWKVELLAQLQAELGSLYAFDQTLLEAMQEGLAVFSSSGKIIFRNAQWQRFCEGRGWAEELDLKEFAAAIDQPSWKDLDKTLQGPGVWLDTEAHLGEVLWQLRAVRLQGSAPNATDLILVVATDETARLERDRARAEALAFVTHELRTPLVAIQGFAEYLLRYSKERAGSEAAATIFQESGRLVAIINTYLDVLRLEAGARLMRDEAFSISEAVRQVARVVQPIARASDIAVHTEMDSDLPALQGDRHLIEGALLNLLSNAIKYSPRGSKVKLTALVERDGVVLEVWNPGTVIPREELGHLFDPFYRRSEQEEKQRGWGVGLAFVKRIAEQHGGRAEASSEPDSGTFFRIHLPATRLVSSEACQ